MLGDAFNIQTTTSWCLPEGGIAFRFHPCRVFHAFDQRARAVLVQVLESKWKERPRPAKVGDGQVIQYLLASEVYDAAESAFGPIVLVFVLVLAQTSNELGIAPGAWSSVVE
jgi:hypothetical protein